MRGFMVVLVASISGSSLAVEPDAPERLISKSEALGIMVQNALQTKMRVKTGQRQMFDGLLAYYAKRGGAPLWVGNGAMSAKIDGVRRAISNAAAFGLVPAEYKVPSLDIRNREAGYSPSTLAAVEADISIAAVLYAAHARSGRLVPQDVDPSLDPSPEVPSASSVLNAIEQEDGDIAQLLESYHPQHPQFKALRALLTQSDRGSKPSSLPTSGPVLKAGVTHPDVALVRQRLNLSAAPGTDSSFYDEALADRIRALQKENGYRVNGAVTDGIRELLQPAPLPKRKLILANMERWRWVPRDLGATHIRINLPEYLVRVVRNDKVDFEERIVIGSPGNQTPVFSNKMRTVVVNPYWNVPSSIATNEIIPLVQRNPGYLVRNGMEAMVNGYGGEPVAASKIDWDNVKPENVVIRQLPGNGNALGELKFLFPNRHNVYLHDTPQKYFFNEKARPFSHGCMRVRNPRSLAQAVLGWSKEKVSQAIAKGGNNQEVAVEPRIPVHVMYFTLWAKDNGDIQQFSDVYGHDKKTIEALSVSDEKGRGE